MIQPLVTILIPTRNRQIYTVKTVKQILSLNIDVQIIVNDNSDDTSLEQLLLEYINSNSIEYYYEKDRLPFSENYNRAAQHARGKYLFAIGDDDGILPNIIDCALWMEKEHIDAVKPMKGLAFYYKGGLQNKKKPCLMIRPYSGEYRFSNPESGLISLLNDGGCNYTEKDLIGSYHGLVSLELMKRVKEITGVFYGGLSPDMFSVACLNLINDIRFAVVDYPISLPGVCPSSGTAMSYSGKHVGDIKSAPHLELLPDYQWSEEVPKFYSVETIWAETMLDGIRKMGRDDLINRYFNAYALNYYIFKNNSKYRKDVYDLSSDDIKRYFDTCFLIENSSKHEYLFRKSNNFILKLFGKRRTLYTDDDILSAVNLATEYLSKTSPNTPWKEESNK